MSFEAVLVVLREIPQVLKPMVFEKLIVVLNSNIWLEEMSERKGE